MVSGANLQMDTLPTVKKQITVFRFDPHPRRKQLAIVGEIRIGVLRGGQLVREFSEQFKKVVKLLSLSQSSRIDVIVNDILQSCPFVEGNLRSNLKLAVDEIVNRDYDRNGFAIIPRTAPDGSYLPRYLEVLDEVENESSRPSSRALQDDVEEADIQNLNHYVEMLYENAQNKTEGLRLISLLTKSNRFLVEITEHASASNAIFRELREDKGRNMELIIYILNICLDMARVHSFHGFLMKHKIHQLVLDKIDSELERCERWKAQVKKREELAQTTGSQKARDEYVTVFENYKSQMERQNSMLQVGFEILHYVSEDRMVASSLIHPGVVSSLTEALDRTDFKLWETVLAFLKNTSTFKEYVEQMRDVNTLGKLAKILRGKTPIPKKLARLSFGLLCNMSFSAKLRHEIIQQKLITSLAKNLSTSSFSDVIAKTFYVISMDPLHRPIMVKHGVVETLLEQLAPDSDPQDKISRIKGGLAVNLAKDRRGAEIMGESMKMVVIVKHSIKNHDTLGMKIVRNVVETRPSTIIDQQAGHIAKAVVEVNSLDFALECVGTLAKLNANTVNFPELLKKNRLVVWFRRQIMNYVNRTNMIDMSYQLKTAVLEVILLLSNVCRNEEGARVIVVEGFIDQVLIRLLHSDHTDPQVIQQIVYLFNVCCQHESVATFLAAKTQFPSEFMSFAISIGGQVRVQCDATLHKLSECNETWYETVMEHEFLIYNEKWTTAVSEQEDIGSISLGATHTSPYEHQLLQELLDGAHLPHMLDDDDDDDDEMGRPSSCDLTSLEMLDDSSTTDTDSSYYNIFSSPESTLFGDGKFETKSTSTHFLELYRDYQGQFGDKGTHSKDWQFFLN
ncbi:Kinesin-associated protein 3 [Orchesella cincta]|uniref:Kinesin-associated protein 3 n=1 Tax=Orchesella cincta TaxID=48709 RepID=A0A1D2M7Y2_ORCCI|nr:Kinesin-associated protein 3 [Orchesella cincta]